ncbi:MAG: LytTR family transcriptional regulator DNA-binding domain-containing protein [Bacteroidota bacterium]
MSKIKILIVEDELIIAEDVSLKLKQMGYSVIAVTDNASDTLRTINFNAPDLIIMDIHLKGETNGIELTKKIKELINVPVIYLTNIADSETVEKAKDTFPSAYILKPFRPRELSIAIQLAISNMAIPLETQLPNSDESATYLLNDRIFIKENYAFCKVQLSEILYLKADGSYTEIITKDKTYILSETLNTFESKLPFKFFVRIHRSWLINVEHIESFKENEVVIHKKEIPIGKTYRPEFKKRFRFL